tara:strand:+ start:488 stop:1732 length:1245 start_codon:yes stop_codon:yes gene_type:complete
MNRFISNIAYLSSGQFLKVILRLIAFSIVAKSLSITQYGQFVTIIAFVELFQIFTLPGMSKPILRSACRDIDNTDEILSSKSGIRNATGLLAILIINIAVIFMDYDSQIVTLVRFYSMVLFIDSIRTYIRIVFKVYEDFKWISLSEIVLSASYLILVLISIRLDFGVAGIIFASLTATILSFFVDLYNSKRFSRFKIFGGFEYDRVFFISAWVFTITNIMWLIITKIDIVMLSKLTTSDEVAMYGVANRIIFFGLMAVSVVSNVIFPPIVKQIKELGFVKLEGIYSQIILVFSTFILGCLIVYFQSDLIISLIADKKYFLSSTIFNILILYVVIQAFATPVKLILYALDKEKLLLYLILPLPILKIVLNLFYFEKFGVIGVAYSTVIVYFVYLLCLLIFNRRLLINTLTKPIER